MAHKTVWQVFIAVILVVLTWGALPWSALAAGTKQTSTFTCAATSDLAPTNFTRCGSLWATLPSDVKESGTLRFRPEIDDEVIIGLTDNGQTVTGTPSGEDALVCGRYTVTKISFPTSAYRQALQSSGSTLTATLTTRTPNGQTASWAMPCVPYGGGSN